MLDINGATEGGEDATGLAWHAEQWELADHPVSKVSMVELSAGSFRL